jgi:hypothetical protein
MVTQLPFGWLRNYKKRIMAISIDTVYQRVLALANKEQRGYITPQEFNLLANQAQMSIFESYFYSKNQRDRLEPNQTDTTESDISKLIDMKLMPFTSTVLMTSNGSGYYTYPADMYQAGEIINDGFACRKVEPNELARIANNVRFAGREPVYSDSISSLGDIRVRKNDGWEIGAVVYCESITKPTSVSWGYVVVNEEALYNADTTTDFNLHDSEEDTLVNTILEMAGIVLNKVGLAQTASGRSALELQTQNT